MDVQRLQQLQLVPCTALALMPLCNHTLNEASNIRECITLKVLGARRAGRAGGGWRRTRCRLRSWRSRTTAATCCRAPVTAVLRCSAAARAMSRQVRINCRQYNVGSIGFCSQAANPRSTLCVCAGCASVKHVSSTGVRRCHASLLKTSFQLENQLTIPPAHPAHTPNPCRRRAIRAAGQGGAGAPAHGAGRGLGAVGRAVRNRLT